MDRRQDIQNAVEVLRKGGIILYPTDTVWGIGCDATNAEAVEKVYKMKQRDDSKAMIGHKTHDGDLGQRREPGTQPVGRRRKHCHANHAGRVLERAVFPLPEAHRLHKRQHQRRAAGTEFLRHQ